MLPESFEKHYEIINGQEVLMSPTGAFHNLIVLNLVKIIGAYLKGKKCKLRLDTFVQFDKDSIFAPDIAIFCKPFKVIGDTIHGIPTFIIEIVSPSTRKKDVGDKKDAYERFGVQEYWIIDPKAESIDVYLLHDGRYVLDESYHNYTEDDFALMHKEQIQNTKMKLKLSLYDDFEIAVKDIFEKDN